MNDHSKLDTQAEAENTPFKHYLRVFNRRKAFLFEKVIESPVELTKPDLDKLYDELYEALADKAWPEKIGWFEWSTVSPHVPTQTQEMSNAGFAVRPASRATCTALLAAAPKAPPLNAGKEKPGFSEIDELDILTLPGVADILKKSGYLKSAEAIQRVYAALTARSPGGARLG